MPNNEAMNIVMNPTIGIPMTVINNITIKIGVNIIATKPMNIVLADALYYRFYIVKQGVIIYKLLRYHQIAR